MFITIRHGADDQKLFNPDCALRLLADNIRKRCHCPAHAAIALTDDSLAIIPLQEHSMENASSLFTDRGTYILLAVEKREGGPPKYTALLDDIEPELAAKLEVLSNPKASDPRVKCLSKSSKRVSKPSLPATSKNKRTNSSTKHRTK